MTKRKVKSRAKKAERHGKRGKSRVHRTPGLARALALAAASSADEEIQVKSGASQGQAPPLAPAQPSNGHSARPVLKPSADDDGDDSDEPMVVMKGGARKTENVDDETHVVAKGPAKFSTEDLEALRKAIVIKGSGRIVAGINLDELKYDQEGLVAVVTQDRLTGAVLMQAWANKEALEKSLTTNEMTYFSRQRNKLWTKGEESGHKQKLVALKVDCDKDAILAIVEQTGVACHRETGTCWSEGRAIPAAGFLGELDQVIAKRAKDKPDGSYTTKLLADPSLAAGKVIEEAKEVATVLKGKPNKDNLQHEAADLLYHLLVACRSHGIGLREVLAELMSREGKKTEKGEKGKS